MHELWGPWRGGWLAVLLHKSIRTVGGCCLCTPSCISIAFPLHCPRARHVKTEASLLNKRQSAAVCFMTRGLTLLNKLERTQSVQLETDQTNRNHRIEAQFLLRNFRLGTSSEPPPLLYDSRNPRDKPPRKDTIPSAAAVCFWKCCNHHLNNLTAWHSTAIPSPRILASQCASRSSVAAPQPRSRTVSYPRCSVLRPTDSTPSRHPNTTFSTCRFSLSGTNSAACPTSTSS